MDIMSFQWITDKVYGFHNWNVCKQWSYIEWYHLFIAHINISDRFDKLKFLILNNVHPLTTVLKLVT